ncbi:hypothetical protein [Singulisphaera sp. PoT]|uniref:hypothetical protein n=1 Tax=Singulisphaera sp. PoT TaxID=3411797 RepID=UPI003BF5FF10
MITPHEFLGSLFDTRTRLVSALALGLGRGAALWITRSTPGAIELDLESARELRTILDTFIQRCEGASPCDDSPK